MNGRRSAQRHGKKIRSPSDRAIWLAACRRRDVIKAALATALVSINMKRMPRLRALAAVFACLAVLAGGLNVAFAAHGVASAARSTVGAPCSDCDDCDKTPCPMPMADCVQMHANPGPALIAAPIDLAPAGDVAVHWSPAHRTLSGLSPPPDPLPPRA